VHKYKNRCVCFIVPDDVWLCPTSMRSVSVSVFVYRMGLSVQAGEDVGRSVHEAE